MLALGSPLAGPLQAQAAADGGRRPRLRRVLRAAADRRRGAAAARRSRRGGPGPRRAAFGPLSARDPRHERGGGLDHRARRGESVDTWR